MLLILGLGLGCTKPFNPPEISEAPSLLVIEGFAVPGPDSTFITLSRTRKLADTSAFASERGARVLFISRSGTNAVLPEIAPGRYGAALDISPSESYQLRIVTREGKVYESNPETLVRTPVVDSLTWLYDRDLTIFVNTTNNQPQPAFFRWEYDETWEYRSFFTSDLVYQNGIVSFRDSADQRVRCWDSATSTGIFLGATEGITTNAIRQAPLLTIPYRDLRLGFRYSLLVRQYGLSREAYAFWQEIRKNGSQVGGLFDPLPTQLLGNWRCITNPDESVIGYFYLTTLQTKRLFIDNLELFGWVIPKPDLQCEAFIRRDSIDYFLTQPGLGPAFFVTGGGLGIAPTTCIDCTLSGGTNQKPVYW